MRTNYINIQVGSRYYFVTEFMLENYVYTKKINKVLILHYMHEYFTVNFFNYVFIAHRALHVIHDTMAGPDGLQNILPKRQRANCSQNRTEQMDSGSGEVQSQYTTGVSLSSTKGHFWSSTDGQAPTPSIAMDMRLLRQVLL